MAFATVSVTDASTQRLAAPARLVNRRGGYAMPVPGHVAARGAGGDGGRTVRPVVASAAFASRRRRAAALCAAVGVAALLVFAVVGLLRPTASTGQSGHDVAHTITIGDVGQNGVRYVVGRGESAWGIAAAMVSPERVGEVAALVDRATASGELVAGTVLVFDKDLVEE